MNDPLAPPLELLPEAARWSELLLRSSKSETLFGESLDAWRLQTRAELGLPVDRPVIVTGHQPDFWHPGILVKDLLAAALAEETGSTAAHVIVEQDDNEPGVIDVPVFDEHGRLMVETVRLLEGDRSVVVGRRPASMPRSLEVRGRLVFPEHAEKLAAIREAFERESAAPTLALQAARAVNGWLAKWITPPILIRSGALSATSFGRALLAVVERDPRRAARTYNEAVRARPEAGLTELLLTDDVTELPLWRVDPSGRRHRAFEHDLWAEDALWPRALVMTLVLRLAVGDLFIHGRGGGVYDEVMEAWCRAWLGVEPAPKVTASVTRRLPFAETSAPALSVTEAIRMRRRLLHDPFAMSLKDAQTPSMTKARLLQAIHDAPSGSRARRERFDELHARLAHARREHAEPLHAATSMVEEAQHHAREAPIRSKRDWAFPLYPDEALEQLAREARRAVASRSTIPAGVRGRCSHE